MVEIRLLGGVVFLAQRQQPVLHDARGQLVQRPHLIERDAHPVRDRLDQLVVVDLPAQPLADHPGNGATARAGLVHEAVLADHPDLSAHDLYMSGPPAMIDSARHRFVDAGLPEDRLYYDSFEYAPDVLAQILAGRAGIRAQG